MKASLTATGILELSPETPLEAYALHKWVNESYREGVFHNIVCVTPGDRPDLVHMKLTV